MKPRLARREFLKQLSATTALVGGGSLIFDTLLGPLLQKAFAQTAGFAINPTGYYVHMNFPGGPPRWMLDLPLTPDGLSERNFEKGSFGTLFEKGGDGVVRPAYVVAPFQSGSKTFYLPPVWGMGTSQSDFRQLLDHTLFIRGMDMEINNHGLSNSRQIAPIIGGLSLSGVVADGAKRPIPTVVDSSSNAAGAFKGRSGFGANVISYTESASTNPISSLLKAFQALPADRSIHAGTSRTLQDQALDKFDQFAQAKGVTRSALSQGYENALALIDQNIFALSDQWATTVEKYRQLIAAALKPAKGTLPGLFDLKIPTRSDGTCLAAQNTHADLPDLRDMVTENIIAPRMAENFAVAEILLDRITSTMTLSFASPQNVLYSSGKSINLSNDQHYIGNMVSTLMTTLMFRAFLSCLTEFVSTLKIRGIFDRTVIHLGSEFNRNPKTDGTGSDHGVSSSGASLISGMIGQCAVIGNIQKATSSSSYKGTIGVAKPYVLEGYDRPIQVNDVARTVSAMLGVEDVTTNGRSLLAPSGQFWIPKKPEAENV